MKKNLTIIIAQKNLALKLAMNQLIEKKILECF